MPISYYSFSLSEYKLFQQENYIIFIVVLEELEFFIDKRVIPNLKLWHAGITEPNLFNFKRSSFLGNL
jgi:hypothetical protein